MPAVEAGKLQIRVEGKWEKMKREDEGEGREDEEEGSEREEHVTEGPRSR